MLGSKKLDAVTETVTDTGRRINQGIDTATLYLVIVGTVAIVSLIVATVALGRSRA